jgi:hypothetical protein
MASDGMLIASLIRYYGGGSMPLGLPDPFSPGLSSAMAAAAAAMAAGDPSAMMALRARLAEVEEENRRLRANGGGRRGGAGGVEEEEDEQAVLDRKCFEAYEAARVAMMATLEAGKFPTAAEYAERDLMSSDGLLIKSDDEF